MRVIVSLFSLSFLLSGCLSIAWHGYKKPVESDFEAVSISGGCMVIGKQNLNAHQWQAIREAASNVCDIFSDPEFKQRVVSQTWLASCGNVHGKRDTISGEEVYRLLTLSVQKYSIHPHQPWNAEGQTETDELRKEYNRVAISPSIIDGWYSNTDTVRSALINIIAHETVHIISERFLDYDTHASSKCPDSMLVSYGIGDLVEEIWLMRRRR